MLNLPYRRGGGVFFALTLAAAPVIAQTWEDITVNVPGPISNLGHRRLDTDGTRLYLLGVTGVYVSSDQGASFQPLNNVSGASYSLTNLGHQFVKYVNGWVWLGSSPGSLAINEGHATLHRLVPGQSEWSKSSATGFPIGTTGNQADDIAYDAATGTYYVAAALGGAFVSTNGLDWEQRTSGLGGTGNPATVAAVNGAAYLLRPLDKVYRTTNQGQSWTALNSHPGTAPGYLCYHRGRLLFTSQGPTQLEDGLYYSDDGGGSWNMVKGLTGCQADITSDGTLLYAAGCFGYLGSDQFKFSATDGLTWDRLPTNGLPASFTASRIVRQGNYLFMHVTATAKLYRLNLTGVDFTPTTQIARQPAATVNRVAGQPLSLEVVAGGAQITYQWRRDGVDLPGATNAVYAVAVAATNDAGAYTVVVTGARGAVTSSVATVNVVVRQDGRSDITYPSLTGGGDALALLSNRELVVFRNNALARYSPEGAPLASRTVSGVSSFGALAVCDASNRLLRISSSPGRVWRFLPDTLANDPAFNQPTFNSTIRALVEWPGRGYLVGGDFTTVTNAGLRTNAISNLALLNYAGVVDTSFIPSNAPPGNVYNIVVDSGTNIYVHGDFYQFPQGSVSLFKLLPDGRRDTNFPVLAASTLPANSFVRGLAPGRLFAVVNGTPRVILDNGSFDPTFNSANQTFSANPSLRGLAVGESNKVYIAGNFNRYAGVSLAGYVRLLPNGARDASFYDSTGSGNITGMAYDPRGYLYYVTSSSGPFRLFAGTIAAAAAEGFGEWVAQFGLTQDLQAAGADADGDGIPNVFEYYFGSSPTNAASGMKPALSRVADQGQEYPAITFVRQKNVSGVTLSAQVSSTVTFSDSLGAATETVTDLGNGLERVTIRSSVSAAAQPVQFLRLRLTLEN